MPASFRLPARPGIDTAPVRPAPAILLQLCCALFILTACANKSVASGSPPPLPEQIVLYDWPDDSIELVFDDFEAETGITVKVLTYESQEEAIASIEAGQVYDVVVMDNHLVPQMVNKGLLAEVDFSNIPNFKNISPGFRDLAYDPGNAHTIPYTWGTTGLLVRVDLVEEPVTRWLDMWDPRYAGRVVNWSLPRYTLAMALLSLGYSANSEDPAELEAALDRLIDLKSGSIWLSDEESIAPQLLSGEAVMGLGWAYDYWLASEGSDDISYVLPEEGAILWGDNFVIPANSPNQYAAELFLNFILRPEVSGEIISHNYYPMANEAANRFVDPEVSSDLIVFPPNDAMRNAELLLPLSPAGEKLHAEIWDRFLAAGPQ